MSRKMSSERTANKSELKRIELCSDDVIEAPQPRSPGHLPEYIGEMFVLAVMTLLHHVSLCPHLQKIPE